MTVYEKMLKERQDKARTVTITELSEEQAPRSHQISVPVYTVPSNDTVIQVEIRDGKLQE